MFLQIVLSVNFEHVRFTMMQGEVIARSSISSELKRNALFKGTLFTGIGMFILFLSGAFLHAESLRIWGFPLFLVGGGLITYGMLPYRKLTRIEMNPYQLIHQPGQLILSRTGKDILSIPLSGISEIKFIKEVDVYGIGFVWNKKNTDKIVLYDFKYQPQSLPEVADLYLPYFSQRAVNEIKNDLNL